MQLFKKIATGITTSALLAQMVVAPAFGAISVEMTGNGSGTDNNVGVSQENSTVVEQSNTANISNQINANANTGDNDASDNTGGDVKIDTGNATTAVSVENAVNSNEAHVACGGCPTDVDVKVSGNGTKSDNKVDLDLSNETFVEQRNYADINNDVYAGANSGKNDAGDNTGGDVSIDTGKATAVAEIANRANANVAHVGGNSEGELNLWITGNGSHSDSEIDVDLANAVVLGQSNWADISNDVEVYANTGKNDANDSTGGEVEINTGSAFAGAAVDTEANFNLAHVEDCCELDGTIKVAGNGTDSDNDVDFDTEFFLGVEQKNDFDCGNGWGWWKSDCNDVEAKANTGKNDVDEF